MQKFPYDNSHLDNEINELFLTIKRKDGERLKSKSLHSIKYGIKQSLIKGSARTPVKKDFFPECRSVLGCHSPACQRMVGVNK